MHGSGGGQASGGTAIAVWQQFDGTAFVGGLGLFLFAMHQLEFALERVSAGTLRRFLQRFAGRSLNSVGVGVVATALLQSSSFVGLMVLALAGAGVLTLHSALGVVFGANLGTTITGWLVATVGFKLDLGAFAYPAIGIGAFMLIAGRGRLTEVGRIVVAVGLLILGMSLMKAASDSLAGTLDTGILASFQPWQYLFFGVLFAAIVQSSSATMLVALAALSSGTIELSAAAAIAVGADLGTTSTVMLGAVFGAPIKKRAAAAHLIFNVTTTVLAFALLQPLLDLVARLGISDPLYSLVAFHSIFNALGIVIFLPAIPMLARFLEGRFEQKDHLESRYISQITAEVSSAAVAALEQEADRLIRRVIVQNRHAFTPPLQGAGQDRKGDLVDPAWSALSFIEMYRRNKQLEGEILAFSTAIQLPANAAEEQQRLLKLLASARNAIHSAKSITDIHHNLQALADAANDSFAAYLPVFRSAQQRFHESVDGLNRGVEVAAVAHDYAALNRAVHEIHDDLHGKIYADIRTGKIAKADISSLLNVNRELLNANLSLLLSLEQFDLTASEADTLRESSSTL